MKFWQTYLKLLGYSAILVAWATVLAALGNLSVTLFNFVLIMLWLSIGVCGIIARWFTWVGK